MYTYVYIHTLQQTLQHTVQSHCSKVVNIQRRPLCCDTHCNTHCNTHIETHRSKVVIIQRLPSHALLFVLVYVSVCARARVCVCVCVCERERERECVRVCVYVSPERTHARTKRARTCKHVNNRNESE